MEKIKKHTLKNGLQIVLIKKPDSPATTALVMVAAGSKYEAKNINGISHFLEHMCFKGTTNRPNAIDISSELESLGAQFNAFTGEEYTGYYAKVASRYTKKIIDVVSDLYLNPTLPESEIEKEKGVVIEEINMYEDLPMRRVHELMGELLYGDQPAGWSIAGTREIVQSLTRKQIATYRDQHYVASATTVVVCGNFDEKKVLDHIKKTFSGISTAKKHDKKKTRDTQKSPAIKLQYKKTDQTHLVIGLRAYDMHDKRRFALGVLADILGGGMSSRLFQEVRERLGAAYYVRAQVDTKTDHGALVISAGVDHRKLNVVIRGILEQCKLMKNGDITAEEITKAKNHMIGNLMIGLETSDQAAMFYGTQETLKRKSISAKELAQKISAVTKKDIENVAKDIFKNSKLNLALIGPAKSAAPLKKILTF